MKDHENKIQIWSRVQDHVFIGLRLNPLLVLTQMSWSQLLSINASYKLQRR